MTHPPDRDTVLRLLGGEDDIGGEAVIDSRSANERIAALPPGTSLEVSGVRDGKPYRSTITISRRPPPRG